MTKIMLEFDSETKDFSVTMDGEVLKDISHLSYYTFMRYKDFDDAPEKVGEINISRKVDKDTTSMMWVWTLDGPEEAEFTEFMLNPASHLMKLINRAK